MANVPKQEPAKVDKAEKAPPVEDFVTPQAVIPKASALLGREEKLIYRDEDGNELSPELVSKLEKEGKVTFKTRYETKTRILDEDGNEIEQIIEENVAPPHPDVEGQNPETPDQPRDRKQPASAAGESESREVDQGKPKPASEGNEATAA